MGYSVNLSAKKKILALSLTTAITLATSTASAAPEEKVSFGSQMVDAAETGDTLALKNLISAGANPNEIGEFGATPLMRASYHNNVNMVKMLVSAQANVDISDMAGATALSIAAREGHNEIVAELLKSGADFDATDKEGFTPLMRAVDNGNIKNVQALVAAGAKLNFANAFGKTALSLAKTHGQAEIAELLTQNGAKMTGTYKPGRQVAQFKPFSGGSKILAASGAADITLDFTKGRFSADAGSIAIPSKPVLELSADAAPQEVYADSLTLVNPEQEAELNGAPVMIRGNNLVEKPGDSEVIDVPGITVEKTASPKNWLANITRAAGGEVASVEQPKEYFADSISVATEADIKAARNSKGKNWLGGLEVVLKAAEKPRNMSFNDIAPAPVKLRSGSKLAKLIDMPTTNNGNFGGGVDQAMETERLPYDLSANEMVYKEGSQYNILDLGSFKNEDFANKKVDDLKKSFPDIFGNLPLRVIQKGSGSSTSYQVNAGILNGQDQAIDICKKLISAGTNCRPVETRLLSQDEFNKYTGAPSTAKAADAPASAVTTTTTTQSVTTSGTDKYPDKKDVIGAVPAPEVQSKTLAEASAPAVAEKTTKTVTTTTTETKPVDKTNVASLPPVSETGDDLFAPSTPPVAAAPAPKPAETPVAVAAAQAPARAALPVVAAAAPAPVTQAPAEAKPAGHTVISGNSSLGPISGSGGGRSFQVSKTTTTETEQSSNPLPASVPVETKTVETTTKTVEQQTAAQTAAPLPPLPGTADNTVSAQPLQTAPETAAQPPAGKPVYVAEAETTKKQVKPRVKHVRKTAAQTSTASNQGLILGTPPHDLTTGRPLHEGVAPAMSTTTTVATTSVSQADKFEVARPVKVAAFTPSPQIIVKSDRQKELDKKYDHGLTGREIWIKVDYFNDQSTARMFWNSLKAQNAELSSYRMRTIAPLNNYDQISAEIGPFATISEAYNACGQIPTDQGLNCSLNTSIPVKYNDIVEAHTTTIHHSERGPMTPEMMGLGATGDIRHSTISSGAGASFLPSYRTDVPESSTPDVTVGGSWTAQLGSYDSYDTAEAMWKSYSHSNRKLRKLSHEIVPANGKFRLRVNGIKSPAKADALCDDLRSKGISCILVKE